MHRLVRHPPLGHPTRRRANLAVVAVSATWLSTRANFLPGSSLVQREASWVRGESARSECRHYRTARARSLATNTFLRERYLGNLAIAIFEERYQRTLLATDGALTDVEEQYSNAVWTGQILPRRQPPPHRLLWQLSASIASTKVATTTAWAMWAIGTVSERVKIKRLDT